MRRTSRYSPAWPCAVPSPTYRASGVGAPVRGGGPPPVSGLALDPERPADELVLRGILRHGRHEPVAAALPREGIGPDVARAEGIVGVRLLDDPGTLAELAVELARGPARVARVDANPSQRLVRAVGVERPQRAHHLGARLVRAPEIAECHHRLRRDGAAQINEVVRAGQLREHRDRVGHPRIRAAAEYHAHRPVGRVLQDQHDRAPEVVEERRRRDQEMSTHTFLHLRTFCGMNGKVDTARVFERIFEIYRDQFTLLIPAALVVFVPVAIISGVIYAGDVGILGALIVAAIGTIATYWFQGMVVEAARDILDGRRDHTVGSLVRSATPVIAPLLIAGILAGLGIGIGLILLLVPGLYLLTIWAVIAPVIVIERRDALGAFGRSRELVRGHGWQVFGVILVLFLLQFVVTAVIQALANSVADSVVGYSLADLIVRLLVAPLSALAAAVLYFELTAIRGEPVLAEGPAAVPAPEAPTAVQPQPPPPPPPPEPPAR